MYSLSAKDIALWLSVTLTPEDNNIKVFNIGKPKASTTLIPYGGHMAPIQIDGDKLKWKKARNNAKKNMTSDAINSNMPKLILFWTALVWLPSTVPSVITSENQPYKLVGNENIRIKKKTKLNLKKWK